MKDRLEKHKALQQARSAAAGQAPESIEMVNFKEQLIGYIRDELDQGFSLKQIHAALVEQGYDPQEIGFVITYVKTRFHLSEKEESGDRKKRTDEHHLHVRFMAPVVGIVLLCFALMAIFYTVDGAEQLHEREITELLPYYKMGLDPETTNIVGSKELAKRTEYVDTPRAQAMLRSKKGNVFFDNVVVASDVIDSVYKTVNTYTVEASGSSSAPVYKTLVEIRAKAKAPAQNLKIIEVIPKFILPDTDNLRLTSGLVLEKDPIIQFAFSDVRKDQLLVIRYIIDDKLKSYETLTFAVVQKQIVVRGPTECGNGLCEVGESYMACCVDCGCLPGFDCMNNKCSARPKDECEVDAQCNDGDFSTEDICSGTPKTCSHEAITECAHGDSYCPLGCVYDDDLDCEPPEVFQPETEEVETYVIDTTSGAPPLQPNIRGRYVVNKSLPPWDPAFMCHEDWWCTDGDSCTEDLCNMDTNKCYWEDIVECIDDDFCCPPGCSGINDDDC
ncbi:TPA: hypothetical protein HA265_00180 [Candidatus Woesearchaeota archaeon]|nr:hypothetical protein [Candidatus Woesearchaeota archaeon]